MAEYEITLRKQGDSLGAVFTKDIVEALKLKENQKIHVIIMPQSSDTFKKTFGMLKGKLKRTAQEMKDDIRTGLYGN